jgi:hypothetical protein
LSELEIAVGSENPNHEVSTVGEVVGECPSNDINRVTVRWRTSDGQLNEQQLTLVKGVTVGVGDLVLLQRPANWHERIITHVLESLNDSSSSIAPEVIVDGKRIQIEGKDEIILQCGKASITLHRNGRVIIRGAYVETRSSGTNRIKGGAVLIN